MIEELKKPKHAICSASGAERWLNCPGSVALGMECPIQEASPYAQEGTRAHGHAEGLLRAWERSGRVLRDEDIRTEEDLMRPEDVATGMLEYVLTYVNLCLDEVEGFDAPPAARIEQKLTLHDEMAMFGTADFLATGIRDGRATGVIVDLKYGKGKRVKTEENPQLSYYAVALRKTSRKPLEVIKLRVVQPRIPVFYSEQWYTDADLRRWEETLILGAEQALMMAGKLLKPELKRGSWCYFCPAKEICPEYRRPESAEDLFPDDLV